MTRISIVCVLLFCTSMLSAKDCIVQEDGFAKITDNFSFIASSGQGAVGDVVAVDVALRVDELIPTYRLYAMHFVLCYDSNQLELLPGFAYSTEWDELIFWNDYSEAFEPVSSASPSTRAVIDGGVVNPDAITKYLAQSSDPVPLVTAFFRIKGKPGDVANVAFNDNQVGIEGQSCMINGLYYSKAEPYPWEPRLIDARSTLHENGTIHILEGPASHPDRPELPPESKVYPEAPTPATASLVFELTGGIVQPGAKDVPIEVYVTSNFEFSGYALSIAYDPAQLELTRAEEYTRPGVYKIDNVEGSFGLVMSSSRRRITLEGERVHLATLYGNLKPAAAELGNVSVELKDRNGYLNWVNIFYTGGENTNPLPVAAHVEPLQVTGGLLKLQQEPTLRGDVNADFAIDVSDPIALLNHLFLGAERLECPEAADFNSDLTIDISDPVAILGFLFLGRAQTLEKTVLCNL